MASSSNISNLRLRRDGHATFMTLKEWLSSPSLFPPRKLARVKELIEANLEGDLSLKILARESGYSRAHFARLFRAATGMTAHRYVLERRIPRARQLLAQPDLS
jgi:AraC family transcriptional regulator